MNEWNCTCLVKSFSCCSCKFLRIILLLVLVVLLCRCICKKKKKISAQTELNVRAMVFLLSSRTTKDSKLTQSLGAVEVMTAGTPFYIEIIGVLKKPQGMDRKMNPEGSDRRSLGGAGASNLPDVSSKESSGELLGEARPCLFLGKHSTCPFIFGLVPSYRPSFCGPRSGPLGFHCLPSSFEGGSIVGG